MDRIVKEAMAKWPNVPACTGWLALDRRGRFRMRDEACQAADAPGEPIRHAALNAFIARNYTRDAEGRWFFQNGPQRVFVDLDYVPLVVRLHHGTTDDGLPTPADAPPVLIDQCAQPFIPSACWCDEQGSILFAGQRGRRIDAQRDHAPRSASNGATDSPTGSTHDTDDATNTVALLYDQDLDLFLTLFPDAANKMAALLEAADTASSDGAIPATLLWPGKTAPLPCGVIDARDVPVRFGFHQRPVA